MKLWNQSLARKSLLGGDTMNPSIAAKSLLGKTVVARASRKLKSYGRRRSHRGNPLPALAGVLGGLKGLFGGPDPEKQKQRLAHIEGLRDVVAGTQAPWAGMTQRLALTNLQGIAQGRELMGVAINPTTVAAAQAALSQLGKDPSGKVAGAAPTPTAQLTSFLGTPGGALVAGKLIQGVTSTGRRSTRQRYPTYTDRYGRQRYSYKPPGGAPMRLPAGAQMSVGTPYNFFTGAIGKGGAAATAGQLAVGAAAGAAAYLVTQRLLEYLGGRAQSKEEAGVNAAKALHQALEDYKTQHGAYPPPAERQQMKEAYRQQLVELGYNPDTFTRERGAVAEFFETYNPFGG